MGSLVSTSPGILNMSDIGYALGHVRDEVLDDIHWLRDGSVPPRRTTTKGEKGNTLCGRG